MRPSEYHPQLATLVREPPDGDDWIHEIKYDGYRIGCRIRDGDVTLITRNGNDWTAHFPTIAAAASGGRARSALLDGEAALVLPDGRTSFQALQSASKPESNPRRTAPRGTLVYFVFDLLDLDGESIAALPVEERKARLRSLLGRQTATSRIRYAAHVVGNGRTFFEQAGRLGLEGIISKRRGRPYHPGRHRDWLKSKCTRRQEFVIGGFTDPEGARAGLGALLIGHYDDEGRLVFSGKVGTGFTQASAIDLRARLERIRRTVSPFTPPPPGALARAHWVAPALVAEVVFTEWTDDGRIRHPSFQGLRGDKAPEDVRRETPE